MVLWYPALCIRHRRVLFQAWRGYEDGEWWIMNPAAVYTVDFALASMPTTDQINVLDMCAGSRWEDFSLKKSRSFRGFNGYESFTFAST